MDDRAIEVRRGEVVGLIGPNGAGKTTLLDLVSGYDRPDEGGIRFEGRRIDGLASHRIARRGIVRTFQLTRVFAAMSVTDIRGRPREFSGQLYSRSITRVAGYFRSAAGESFVGPFGPSDNPYVGNGRM